MKGNNPSSFKNESIPLSDSATVRVVYKDSVTGENQWQLLPKLEAIKLARKMELDLVLGDSFRCLFIAAFH